MQSRMGQQRVSWLDSITNSTDMNLSKLQEIVEDRGAWNVAAQGRWRVRWDLVTERDVIYNITLSFRCIAMWFSFTYTYMYVYTASLIAHLVKNPPAMQETLVQFLGREDPLEKGQATHSSILGLPWGLPGKESTCNVGDLGPIPGLGRFPGGGKGYPLQLGLQKVWHDWATFTFHFPHICTYVCTF